MNKKCSTSCRRSSCSVTVRHLWKAIEVIHYQRQQANFERIHRYMNRVHGMKSGQLKVHLEHCVSDGVIILIKSMGNKGRKSGVLQEAYVIPKHFEKDCHDWYCFECHSHGEVLCCSSCYRVYHISCVSSSLKTDSEFKCILCISSTNENLTVERLNHLLSYIFSHLEERLPASATQWQNNISGSLLMKFLIFTPMNLNILQKKIWRASYSHIEHFKADVLTILHNVAIYEGPDSPLVSTVKEVINDCLRDIKEINLCADCYQISNEKTDDLWFCKPCNPPHELVYAQVKGYPFWPAKVIEKINDQYDVRFFGGYHQRALIDSDRIKPITEDGSKLQKLPKSTSWQKALKELELYQMLLQQGISHNFKTSQECRAARLMKVKKTRRKSRSKRKRRVNRPKELLSKYLLQNVLFENESSDCLKRPELNMKFPRKRKWEGSNIESEVKNTEDNKKESADLVSFPSPLSVSTQTHCSLHHNHHKTIFEQSTNQELKPLVDVDYNEVVSDIMNELRMKNGESSYSDIHAFCNKYCPLNKYRQNVFHDIEIEIQIKDAMAVATKVVNDKYDEIVDNLAQSHNRTISEIKKKIWCVMCHEEASIHCCWNVDYCSQKCQNEHWERNHKLVHAQHNGEDDRKKQNVFKI